jgi:hypothetical protein
VGELETEYGDQVDFVVIDAEETEQRGDELELYLLASRSHGLVAFDAAGEVVVTIAGHQFGREEIVMAIGQITE